MSDGDRLAGWAPVCLAAHTCGRPAGQHLCIRGELTLLTYLTLRLRQVRQAWSRARSAPLQSAESHGDSLDRGLYLEYVSSCPCSPLVRLKAKRCGRRPDRRRRSSAATREHRRCSALPWATRSSPPRTVADPVASPSYARALSVPVQQRSCVSSGQVWSDLVERQNCGVPEKHVCIRSLQTLAISSSTRRSVFPHLASTCPLFRLPQI